MLFETDPLSYVLTYGGTLIIALLMLLGQLTAVGILLVFAGIVRLVAYPVQAVRRPLMGQSGMRMAPALVQGHSITPPEYCRGLRADTTQHAMRTCSSLPANLSNPGSGQSGFVHQFRALCVGCVATRMLSARKPPI